MAEALAGQGFATTAVYVTSLKDEAAVAPLARLIAAEAFDIVLNATAFSARLDDGEGTVLDAADAPVLQVVLAGSAEEAWRANPRGLGPADLAMHVALPEIDGRILTRAVSFKAAHPRDAATEFNAVAHRPLADRVAFVAELAAGWARLRRKPAAEKRLACVLPDYPARGGRTGYAVGLDTPASAVAIAEILGAAGYDVADCDAAWLIAALAEGPLEPVLTLKEYETALAATPSAFREAIDAAWGDPAADPACLDGAFRFRFVRLGRLVVAVQPDRGDAASRKGDYHDLTLPPRHAYAAFHFWLTRKERVDALIQLGAHGTLEWLPGKAVALTESCAPEVLRRPDARRLSVHRQQSRRGGAGQAPHRRGDRRPPDPAADRRRLAWGGAGARGAVRRIRRGAGARSAPRARHRRADPRTRARHGPHRGMRRRGEGAGGGARRARRLALRPQGHARRRRPACVRPLAGKRRTASPRRRLTRRTAETLAERVAACGAAESLGLLTALAGRFLPPGPAGAPARGRLDVLPTGRNLYAVDPRSVPTRNAWEIGRRAADEVLARYAQDHGDWPKRIVLDLWGSATMRTGGDDLAQAFALIGCRPTWDVASNRVAGFEILPLAMLGRPRVDATLRISGLFRDVFPSQIALYSAAVRAVAALEESEDDNPLVAFAGASLARVFGAAPGAYGVGLGRRIAEGAWGERAELADAYLAATSHAYDGEGEAREAASAFRDRVAGAELFVHVQDLPGQDALDADAFSEHEGGFAAAAERVGARPALYHLDSSRAGAPKVRRLEQEIARSVRGRAANPRWLAGQMRHGHRGAAEIAQSLDNLYAFAALTDAVRSEQFDLMFDATLGDDAVRAFLVEANRLAARHMARVFVDAERRGFWRSRRNSTTSILETLAKEAA